MERYPHAAQLKSLRQFANALGSSNAALRRDECGDPVIVGQRGPVYAICGSLDEPKRAGWQFFVGCDTGMAWTYAKRAFKPFAGEPTNEGDEGGAFILHRPPTQAEAETIRRYCGIPKKRDLSDTAPSEAQLAARVAFAERRRAQLAA